MLINELGNKYHRLTVISRANNYPDGTARWLCVCECGNYVIHKGSILRSHAIMSCGCYVREIHTTHGMNKSPEYKSWQAMKDRCNNHNNKNFSSYGGRGIKVCSRWENSFIDFFADMGHKKYMQSIERKDNNGDYTPQNCIWGTPVEQANNRRSSKYVTINGVTKTKAMWARHIGITHQAFQARIKKSSDPLYLLSNKMNPHGKPKN